MGLIKLALGNIYGVIVFALFIAILGSVALVNIPVDILPQFKTPAVQVLTYFNGMPARSIERTITDRVERWVNQAPGVASVESRSVSGVSIVKLYFQDDIDPSTALTQTNSLTGAAIPYLPTNTLPPVSLPFDPTGTIPLGVLTVSNPNMSEQAVKDLARVEVRNRLGGVRGCVAPVVVGGKDRRIMVYLDHQKLEARDLSPVDVVKALDQGNLMVSPGTAYIGDNQYALDTNAMSRTVEDIGNIPIVFDSERQILLRDVSTTIDDAVIQKSRVRVNGRQQVFVPIYRQQGASSLVVADGVKRAIPEMEAELPEGSKLDFVIDQTEYVRIAIESLIHEGIIGAILVSIMILVFLGDWRMTIIATLALPLSILGAIIGLSVSGNTINVMTLGGLFLAIGPLVDNVIVVLENIHRHIGMGKSAYHASLDATSELTLPVVVATLALIIVLCPVALTSGVGGFLFKPLTLAVGFAMIFSFVLSWTFVPALCSKLLRGHGHKGHGHEGHGHETEHPQEHNVKPKSTHFFARVYAKIDGFLILLTRGYSALLKWALDRKFLVLGMICLLFLCSLTLLNFIGQAFFPAVDAGQISIQVRAPSNLRLDATERRIVDVEKTIADTISRDELEMVVSEIGLNNDWSAAYSQNAGQQDTVIRIQLTPERTKSAQEYAIVLRKAFANVSDFSDLEFSFDTGGMVSAALNFGASSPIDIQITGGTPEEKLQLAKEVRGKVRLVEGTADVRVLQRNDAPYLNIEINRESAAAVGLSARDVVMQVVTAMNSSIALTRNFWIDPKSGNQYFIAIQYPDNPSFRINDLNNMFATGTNQKSPVRLSSLVTIRESTQSVEFNHVGLKRIVNVLVNTEDRDIGNVASDITKTLKSIDIPKGMRIELKGEYARMTESFRSLGIGLALASVLVYLLMVPLMRSFVMPTIIMAAVPLGLIGVLTMLWATKTTLNVQSEMGVIFLVGIIVSQGVLLLDYANQLRKNGKSSYDAITEAASTRFRPILMTFLATFLDLLPMALGLGRGSESLTPLARAVVGGLLASTPLTLFVVPILFQGLVKEATPTSLVQSNKETAENKRLRPAYGELVDLPIDLPTVIRLVDSNSPTVGIAQARVREAQARLDRAEVQWLPNLTAGVAYNRFDGQTQNQRGDVFGVSRANLFAGGGPALSLDLSEAIYRPLIERQLTSAEQFRAMAVCLNAELDAVLAYFDLLQIYGSLEINAETIAKAESMLKAAEDAKDAKLDRTAGDVNRAQTEVLFRQIERMELLGRTGAASARLGKLLLLQPNVKLVPVDISVVPINLIDPNTTIDELVSSAVSHRPDLAAMRNLISAAWANVRKSEEGPRLPKLAIANQSGAYGGGLNGDLGDFDSRNALSAQIYWEVKNLGFGNQFDIAERRAMLNQTRLQFIETRARAIAEIVEVAQVAAAKYESLALAERTIEQASELYRINKEGTLNVVEAKNLFDALRPLQAIQTLNQARQGYLSSIIEFNRAQYRLYTLLGNQTNPALGS